MGGEMIDAALALLDRQVVDSKGHLVCNVDDLEFSDAADGGSPYASGILAGPAAVAPRLGGLLGRWFVAVQRRMHPDRDPSPARIDFGVVSKVGTAVEVSLPREQLQPSRLEVWARETVISKIPGSSHEAE
jgi:sporulation protein YlmC with PRC-barrel domain